MGVVVSMYSLVVRRSAIEQHYPSGWTGFVAAYPKEGTFRADSELVRFGAMGPYLGRVRAELVAGGIPAADMAQEPLHEVPWLEVGSLKTRDGFSIVVCRLRDGSDPFIAMPIDSPPAEEVIEPGAPFVPWTGPR